MGRALLIELRRVLSTSRVVAFAHRELSHLTHIQPSDRHWSMPFAAALASGAPLFVGAYFGHIAYGLVSSLGGMVFLYLPATALQHRMVWLMACAFAMVTCYTLGLTSHLVAPMLLPVLVFIAVLTMMAVRLYRIGPPGGLFFIMAAAIGAYTPVSVEQYSTLVVRHYGSAVVFITPLTILLADAADLGATSPAALMQARLLDTALGALIGLLGGICLHDARIRAPIAAALRKLAPRSVPGA